MDYLGYPPLLAMDYSYSYLLGYPPLLAMDYFYSYLLGHPPLLAMDYSYSYLLGHPPLLAMDYSYSYLLGHSPTLLHCSNAHSGSSNYSCGNLASLKVKHSCPEYSITDGIVHPQILILDDITILHIMSSETMDQIDSMSISFILELYARIFLNFHRMLSTWIYIDINIAAKCKRIRLSLERSIIRKHDYLCYINKLPISQSLKSVEFILYIAIFCHVYLHGKKHMKKWYKIRYFFNVNRRKTPIYSKADIVGGGSNLFSFEELYPYFTKSIQNTSTSFKYKTYVLKPDSDQFEYAWAIPLSLLVSKLTISELRTIAASHKVFTLARMHRAEIQLAIKNHVCGDCKNYISVFEPIVDSEKDNKNSKYRNLIAVKNYQAKKGIEYKLSHLESVKKNQKKNYIKYKATHLEASKKHRQKNKSTNFPFPPPVPTYELQHTIISNACKEMRPKCIIESGCAVCGVLTPVMHLTKLSNVKLDLDILMNSMVTRQERFTLNDPIKELKGPILVQGLDSICELCYKSLAKEKIPKMALANGKWLGTIPEQLKNLSYAEQLLVARIRHNRCIVKVSSGMHKMRANAITFANPIPKIYDILPPPIKELDEVLAFIYTGPCQPTKADFERTPLLVRRKKIRSALEWLKLNHADYYDLEISQENLDEYPEDGPPVVVDYHQSFTNKNPESTAINDNEVDEGTETGKCPFVVHGLTGEEYTNKSVKALKAIALKHLTSNGKILAIGHAEQPQSMYNNPQLFPQIMPWLFPYGLGGIGNDLQKGNLSDIAHKKHLLMYYDKRFQMDPHFPLIAFNHEQIKESTTAGYLLAEKSQFENISKRLMDVDLETLTKLARRMEDGENVKPETDEEILCFQLIKDLDHVGGHVKGSITSKKYMRNEIWSLISFIGAPSWFITFAPTDNKHPISLYFADTKETFKPELRSGDERYRLIANNPVAGARFFHFMCEIFIKHVLGVDQNHSGIYGETQAYYGTVEQQGRLTLHLHLLLWIRGCLSPQDIRDKIMDPTSEFQKKMIEYLESVHVGEFLTGSMSEVKAEIDKNKMHNQNYQDPTQILPEAPPSLCDNDCSDNCDSCKHLGSWWNKFKHEVDDLIYHSNRHNCGKNQSSGEKSYKKDRPTCINKYGNCKARFPRQVFTQTEVDSKTGALNMKKREPWINTLTPIVTYLLRCNSDVTSLLSGTSIKAVVAYVSDYVTKPGLKHIVFLMLLEVFLIVTQRC
jgi:hypothetical protein